MSRRKRRSESSVQVWLVDGPMDGLDIWIVAHPQPDRLVLGMGRHVYLRAGDRRYRYHGEREQEREESP